MIKKYDLKTDIAIIGAGPAGMSTALFLSKEGVSHLLFDKACFPRDKVCGDGLSGKTIGLFNELNPNLVQQMSADPGHFLPSWGVSFIAPNGKGIELPFKKDMSGLKHAPGFTSRRIDFDDFLLKQINSQFTNLQLETEVVQIKRVQEGFELELIQRGKRLTCLTKVVVGAGGTASLVARKLAGQKIQPQHLFAGLRVYYKNISEMHPQNFIELHFIPEAIPGYLWIFPLPNNQANVGIGILSKDIKDKNIHLKTLLQKALQTNPVLARRFKDAEAVSSASGWRLPLGSIKRPLSGERYLLTGDAAALIDPFTGEGIGNAILSGKFAAKILAEAVRKNDFSAAALKEYDRLLYADLWSELQISYNIQRLVRFPALFNFVINRVHNNSRLQETFSSMFNDVDMRAKLRSPLFYFRLLFNLKGGARDDKLSK